MPKVTVRNNNIVSALRVFKKKVNESGLLLEYREKQFYEKPSSVKNRKKQAAKNREKKRQYDKL